MATLPPYGKGSSHISHVDPDRSELHLRIPFRGRIRADASPRHAFLNPAFPPCLVDLLSLLDQTARSIVVPKLNSTRRADLVGRSAFIPRRNLENEAADGAPVCRYGVHGATPGCAFQ